MGLHQTEKRGSPSVALPAGWGSSALRSGFWMKATSTVLWRALTGFNGAVVSSIGDDVLIEGNEQYALEFGLEVHHEFRRRRCVEFLSCTLAQPLTHVAAFDGALHKAGGVIRERTPVRLPGPFVTAPTRNRAKPYVNALCRWRPAGHVVNE